METNQEIDVTGIDLVKLTQLVYQYSECLGMGILHYKPGDELSDDEAKQLVKETSCSRFALNLDYVHGRACKFGVFKRKSTFRQMMTQNKWYQWFCIENTWRDHSFEQVKELIEKVKNG